MWTLGWSSETNIVIFLLQMYAIGMRLLFRDDQVSVDGVGLSTAEIDISVGGIGKRANAIAVAQKSARSAALMNAFQKVLG